MATVQKLAGGIPIDYYVAVDMNGLYTVVEGIGGADVNVEAEYVHCTFDTVSYTHLFRSMGTGSLPGSGTWLKRSCPFPN